MEYFAAGGTPKWEYIARLIDASDYFAVIIAHSYGSTIEEEGGISYTEKEFDYAVSKGLRPLVFLLHEDTEWRRSNTETLTDRRARLDAFKSKAGKFMAATFHNADSLATKYVTALTTAIQQDPRTGWVRATHATSQEVAKELARLSEENRSLTSKLQAGAHSRDFQLEEAVQATRRITSTSNPDWTLVSVFGELGMDLILCDYFVFDVQNIPVTDTTKLAARDLSDLLALNLIELHQDDRDRLRLRLTAFGREVYQYMYRQQILSRKREH
jgi:hypothetical protein